MPMMIATASRVGVRLMFSGFRIAVCADEGNASQETVMVLLSELPLISTAVIVNWVSCPTRATLLML